MKLKNSQKVQKNECTRKAQQLSKREIKEISKMKMKQQQECQYILVITLSVNQKTHIGKKDQETKSSGMLYKTHLTPNRNSYPQNQTMENNELHKQKPKTSRSYAFFRQSGHSAKIEKKKRKHCILAKGKIQQKKKIIKMYASNNSAQNFIK